MKLRIILSLIALLLGPASTLKSQSQPEQLNLPGDNLNLYAVMKIFQESETLEIFEKRLNEEDNRINNLDLNGDGYIDYIKVIDYVEKNVHYVVLQDAITPTENQDVAVFVVKRDPDNKVIIQLIGDEALYGKYYIVEPYYEEDKGNTPNPGYYGNNNQTQTVVVHHTSEYEVASWPVIRFIFLPTYVAWHSPWYWGYYPPHWHPWTPWYWHEYYGYHYYWHHDYYSHFHHGEHYRYDNWHDNYYSGHRSHSNTVYARRDRGDYNGSYSKPESIRDGASYFRKAHPTLVKADMKDPEVKNIRVAPKGYLSNEKHGTNEKAVNNSKENSNMKWAKPANTDTRTGGAKSGKMERAKDPVKHDRMDNKQSGKSVRGENRPEQVKQGKSENKSSGARQDKGQNVKKEEKRSQGGEPARGRSGRQGEKSSKKGDSGSSDSKGKNGKR